MFYFTINFLLIINKLLITTITFDCRRDSSSSDSDSPEDDEDSSWI